MPLAGSTSGLCVVWARDAEVGAQACRRVGDAARGGRLPQTTDRFRCDAAPDARRRFFARSTEISQYFDAVDKHHDGRSVKSATTTYGMGLLLSQRSMDTARRHYLQLPRCAQ